MTAFFNAAVRRSKPAGPCAVCERLTGRDSQICLQCWQETPPHLTLAYTQARNAQDRWESRVVLVRKMRAVAREA
jgi:hypothetical protein